MQKIHRAGGESTAASTSPSFSSDLSGASIDTPTTADWSVDPVERIRVLKTLFKVTSTNYYYYFNKA